ncbi:MAG: phosphate acyltransferase, partial [Bacillota bacterium]|nr:phosphate acyltransferase [Bacillota bacterium]
MSRFDNLLELAKNTKSKKIAVAAAQDEDVLKAVKAAAEEKICIPILIGDKEKIIELSQGINFDLEGIQIIETKDEIEAARKAVSMVSSGQ